MGIQSNLKEDTLKEIKDLIVSDINLSYGERKSLEMVIKRIDEGASFDDSIVKWLKHINEYSKEPSNLNIKKLYNKLVNIYGIQEKEETHVTYMGGYRKMTNVQWALTLLVIIIILIFLYTGKLNSILSFLNKL